MKSEIDLKKLRSDKKMTQVEAANKIGVSIATYRLWEAGAFSPTDANYKKILEAFDILPFAEE
jgi:transcriptional regulator with XRE-family HTH domain